MSIVTDLALTIIPLWIIRNMQLKFAIKMSLVFLLGLSILYVYRGFLEAPVHMLTHYSY